jgi:uncharacterized membrane protein YhaH (DUF805 family)
MSKPVFSNWFAFSGRRNRKSYFLYVVALFVILLVIWGVGLGVAAAFDRGEPSMAAIAVATILSIVIGISHLIVSGQRCRDFGWTGWAVLLSWIPAVGWIFGLAIFFVPGTDGPNRYGPDPVKAAA